MELLKSAHKSS